MKYFFTKSKHVLSTMFRQTFRKFFVNNFTFSNYDFAAAQNDAFKSGALWYGFGCCIGLVKIGMSVKDPSISNCEYILNSTAYTAIISSLLATTGFMSVLFDPLTHWMLLLGAPLCAYKVLKST
jgi:hypothetical protein